MTFNLRTDTKSDGINYFPNRQNRILDMIRNEQPDLIGFQEAKEMARTFLKENLTDRYTVIGCGRAKEYRGEGCLIAFRKDCFDLINLETEFLSSSPRIPGSRYEGSDQSPCPRLYLHAELIHTQDTSPIHFFNTHLDHMGEQARMLGMTQILQQISKIPEKIILTGDMNALPDSPCIALPALLPNHSLQDATASITHSFHNFGKQTENCKIDYIFTDGTPLEAYRIEDTPSDGIYLSDHYPICAWIEI